MEKKYKKNNLLEDMVEGKRRKEGINWRGHNNSPRPFFFPQHRKG